MNNTNNPNKPGAKPTFNITWTDSDDLIEIDATFAKYYQMLLNLVGIDPTVETLHGFEHNTLDHLLIHFKFDGEITNQAKQAYKDMIYYGGMTDYGVSMVRFEDNKYLPNSEYDFTIEVNLRHVHKVVFDGTTFLPGVINKQIKSAEQSRINKATIH